LTEKKLIPVAAPLLGEREVEYVVDAVKSGWARIGRRDERVVWFH